MEEAAAEIGNIGSITKERRKRESRAMRGIIRKTEQMRGRNGMNRGCNDHFAGWRGSYTVEAALVFPIVLFVLAALIICTFYVHDRAVSQSLVCEMASAGSNFITEEERQEAMDAVREQATASRFLGSRNLSLSASSGKTEANAALAADYLVPGMVIKYFAGGSLTIQKKWSSKTPDPAKAIWIMRGLKRLIDGGTK